MKHQNGAQVVRPAARDVGSLTASDRPPAAAVGVDGSTGWVPSRQERPGRSKGRAPAETADGAKREKPNEKT